MNLKLELNSLTRDEMRIVIGGFVPSGTCAWEGSGNFYGVAAVSRDYAEGASNTNGGHWCCDQCCSVSWLSNANKGYLGCSGYSEYTITP